MRRNGFTLLEILVALAIFALVAALTSGALYRTIMIKQKLMTQADRLQAIQATLALLTQDLEQVSTDFNGDNHAVDFKRNGIQNPGSIEKRSSQAQIRWECQNGALIRHSINDRVLLTGLKACNLAYLQVNRQQVDTWSSANRHELPIALHLTLKLKSQGDISWLFIIPAGLYGH